MHSNPGQKQQTQIPYKAKNEPKHLHVHMGKIWHSASSPQEPYIHGIPWISNHRKLACFNFSSWFGSSGSSCLIAKRHSLSMWWMPANMVDALHPLRNTGRGDAIALPASDPADCGSCKDGRVRRGGVRTGFLDVRNVFSNSFEQISNIFEQKRSKMFEKKSDRWSGRKWMLLI